jgi:Spy/CpxP family protein refolding chaperone
MRKMLAAAAMIVVMAGTAAAQGGGGGGGGRGPMSPEQMQAMMENQVGMMFKDITISDDQKKQAVEILTKAQTDMRGIDRQAPDAAEKRAEMTKKRNEALAGILKSDADKAKLAENLKNMPQGRGGRPGGPGSR